MKRIFRRQATETIGWIIAGTAAIVGTVTNLEMVWLVVAGLLIIIQSLSRRVSDLEER